MKSKGPSALISIEILVMMSSLQSIVISGAQSLLRLMGSNEDDPATKHCSFYPNALWPAHLYQNFDPINIKALSTWKNNVLQWGYHNQNFYTYQSKVGGLGCPFDFTSALLVLGNSFSHPGCFLFINETSFPYLYMVHYTH